MKKASIHKGEKRKLLIIDYNQLRIVNILFFFSIDYIKFCFISEVHFQLYEDVFKKVQLKNMLQKLLIRKNYQLEVEENFIV